MSKTGAWVLEMQEDAAELTREQFIAKHGPNQVAIWDEYSPDSKLRFDYDAHENDPWDYYYND